MSALAASKFETEDYNIPNAVGSETSEALSDEIWFPFISIGKATRNLRIIVSNYPSKNITVKRSLERLYALSNLPENWDSYDATPIQSDVINYAAKLMLQIMQEPSVVPTSAGGVQFEWHRKGIDLEVYIESTRAVRFLVEDLHTGNLVERPFDGYELELANWISKVSD